MASVRAIKAGAAYVELFVNDSKLVRGLEAASRKLKAFGSAIGGMGAKMAAIGATATAPLAASGQAFAVMGDQVAKMSRRTGISVESLSELGFAASLSGADIETVEASVRKMQKSLYDASRGMVTAQQALAELGLSVESLQGLSPEAQFKLIGDRLSKVKSPAMRAALAMELFGRAGTKLLPMLADGAAGVEALQEQARAMGLTMRGEDAAAAEALNDAFDALWKVIKQSTFEIGAALAPVLQEAAEWITDIVVRINRWIRENRQVIVTVFKVAAAVVAGGAALVGLGYIVSGLGAAIGVLVTVITGIGTVIGAMGAALAWVLSPIGLVVTAVAALAAYLIYASGAGGQALSWLGERFGELKEFATAAFGGIADALMAGDIALAARILWLSLKIAWEKGIGVLQSAWLSFKHGFLKIAYGAFYGAQAAWEIFNHGLTVAWIETTAFLTSTWTRFSSTVMSIWESTQNWLAKRWIDLMGLFDEGLDTQAAKNLLDSGSNQALARIEQEKQRKLAARDADRAAQRQLESQYHDRNLAQIGQGFNDEAAALDAQKADAIRKAEAELSALRKEWQDAIAEARRKREEKDAQRPKKLDRPQDIPDYLKGLGPTLEEAQKRTVNVAGTFSAMDAMRMGSGGVADRIAKASEQTAKNTKKILDEVEDMDGPEFE